MHYLRPSGTRYLTINQATLASVLEKFKALRHHHGPRRSEKEKATLDPIPSTARRLSNAITCATARQSAAGFVKFRPVPPFPHARHGTRLSNHSAHPPDMVPRAGRLGGDAGDWPFT